MKMEYDYLSGLNGWIKNGHIRKNLTRNGEPQRYSWVTQKKKKKDWTPVSSKPDGVNKFSDSTGCSR